MIDFNQVALPVIPVRNTVLFPGMSIPIRIGREGSLAALDWAQKSAGEYKGFLLALTQKDGSLAHEPVAADLYNVGTVLKVEKVRGKKKDGYEIIVRGVERLWVEDFRTMPGSSALFALGSIRADIKDVDLKTQDALLTSMREASLEILARIPGDTSQLEEMIRGISDLKYLIELACANLEMPVEKRQQLLEMTSLKERSLALLELMQNQRQNLDVQNEIRNRLGAKLGKQQRETILREQLRTIREELGEDGEQDRAEGLRKKLEEAGLPAAAHKIAFDELKRLEGMSESNPEAHQIRSYLEFVAALPWSRESVQDTESLSLDAAREILDADHYGLEKVKKRILQSLAVMKLRKTSQGSILLLVGPPGVGKTSLGQSIARALGRKFVRAALGGIRDDAEIRGHRRTYIGAMPGRILSSLKRAGENNPVILLDEIDKVSRGVHGDPSAALLEVLDPEQNSTFQDHYLDMPYDLSKALFIATANTLDGIPGPLLDRLEIIEVSGYTSAEKLHIAQRHLVPKQLEAHGVKADQLEIEDAALVKVISNHTREAGVRELQRQIASLVRGSTEAIVSAEGQISVQVGPAQVEEILGPDRFTQEVAERLATPGVVTGLAWTPVGGDILFIESTAMPGKGQLTLTGQLGDVMKESAQIAWSLVRSRLASLPEGLSLENRDVHIHVPAGSIPKDGPSAGVTLLTSLASLVTRRSVSPRVAMTGEITLRGAVTPVGGIKEKIIAAHRAGIEKIILSRRNEKDLREVPVEVRDALKFVLVDSVEELLKEALDLTIPPLDLVPQGLLVDRKTDAGARVAARGAGAVAS